MSLQPRKNARPKSKRNSMWMQRNLTRRAINQMERNVQSKNGWGDSKTQNINARSRPSIQRPSHVQNIRLNPPKNKRQIPSLPFNGILMGNRRPHLRLNSHPKRNRPPNVNSSSRLHTRNFQMGKPRINLQRTPSNRRSKNIKIKRHSKNYIRRIYGIQRPTNMVTSISSRQRNKTRSNSSIHPKPRNQKKLYHNSNRKSLHPKQKTIRRCTKILFRRKPTENHNQRMPRTKSKNTTPSK